MVSTVGTRGRRIQVADRAVAQRRAPQIRTVNRIRHTVTTIVTRVQSACAEGRQSADCRVASVTRHRSGHRHTAVDVGRVISKTVTVTTTNRRDTKRRRRTEVFVVTARNG